MPARASWRACTRKTRTSSRKSGSSFSGSETLGFWNSPGGAFTAFCRGGACPRPVPEGRGPRPWGTHKRWPHGRPRWAPTRGAPTVVKIADRLAARESARLLWGLRDTLEYNPWLAAAGRQGRAGRPRSGARVANPHLERHPLEP